MGKTENDSEEDLESTPIVMPASSVGNKIPGEEATWTQEKQAKSKEKKTTRTKRMRGESMYIRNFNNQCIIISAQICFD